MLCRILCPCCKSPCCEDQIKPHKPCFYGQSICLLANSYLEKSGKLKMGQTLMKFASGSEVKAKEIDEIIQKCYDKNFGGMTTNANVLEHFVNSTHFYRAICETIEEINKKYRQTQFRLPDTETLERAYYNHHRGKSEALSREEFQEILEEVIKDSVGLTGFGAKEILLYMFGVPAAALFIKNKVAPKALPNEVFIPVVTSATVYLLAKLNKI